MLKLKLKTKYEFYMYYFVFYSRYLILNDNNKTTDTNNVKNDIFWMKQLTNFRVFVINGINRLYFFFSFSFQ